MEVEGQHHVSRLGRRIGAAALNVAEARAFWSEQHRGPAVDAGREREVPDHRQAVGRVLDLASCDRRHAMGL